MDSLRTPAEGLYGVVDLFFREEQRTQDAADGSGKFIQGTFFAMLMLSALPAIRDRSARTLFEPTTLSTRRSCRCTTKSARSILPSPG
jgi:hypothetical protein